MILNEILTWGSEQFIRSQLYFGHGTDNAWDEAVWLAFHVLKLPFNADQSVLLTPLTKPQIKQIKALYQRRISERIPAAYLLKQAWFFNLSFYVDERVLIPRSPIAELIRKKFKPFVKPSAVKTILDLCTGSACIAVACASVFPDVRVDAVDISTPALSVATINVKKYQLEKRVNLLKSNLFSALVNVKYDIIVSNPPYVDARDMSNLPREYRREPVIALAGGKDGLSLVDKILQQAKRYLAPKGILVVEVGNSALALKKRYPKLPFVWLTFKYGEAEVFLLPQHVL